MSMSDYAEIEAMKYLFTAEALGTRPTVWYVALHTADPTDAGTTNEVFGAWYARQAVSFTRTLGAIVNTGAVTFPAVTGAGLTVTHISIKDALSGGNTLAVLPQSPSKVFAIGDIPNVAASALTFALD
jgi:hypothetical protein